MSEVNSINGDANNNNLPGTPGDDSINGGLGDDRIFGDLGNDFLSGGDGNDVFLFNNIQVIIPSDGNQGNDGKLDIFSSDGHDKIEDYNPGEDSIESIDPEAENSEHEIVATAEVVGEGISDSSSPTDTIEKEIFGTANSDVLHGTSENENIYGYGGDDLLQSKGGNNKMYGGAGNDTLDASKSGSQLFNDTLIGGSGDDTYIVNSRLGRIREYTRFGGLFTFKGGATSKYNPITEKLDEGIDTVKSPVNYKLGNNLENLILIGKEDTKGIGNELNNKITGNSGKNLLLGREGDDYLIGLQDDDLISGEAGNDTLKGGSSSDTLTGGTGADMFVLSSLNGTDSITDFNRAEGDKIQISAIGFGVRKDSLDKFTFDSTSNQLLFEQVVENGTTSTPIATLQPGTNFDPSLDIEIFGSDIIDINWDQPWSQASPA